MRLTFWRPIGKGGPWSYAKLHPSIVGGMVVAVFSLLITEIMHSVLIPTFLARRSERLLAEGISALVVGILVAKLLEITAERRQITVAQLQVIADMNHHIRNALCSISLSAYVTHNEEAIRTIADGVDRIEWALREVLPKATPNPAKHRRGSQHLVTSWGVSRTREPDDTASDNWLQDYPCIRSFS